MSANGTASERRGTGLLPAGIVIALLVAVAGYMTLRSAEPPDETVVTSVVAPVAPQVSEPAAEAPVEQEQTPAQTDDVEADAISTAVEEAAAPEADVEQEQAPSVDEVRVDGTGTMVVAGRAAPGSQVDVLVDGEVVSSAQVDDSGAFAALTTLPEDDGARSLTLRSETGGETVASKEEIILAPVISVPAQTGEDSDVAETVEVETASLEPTAKDEAGEGQTAELAPADQSRDAASEGADSVVAEDANALQPGFSTQGDALAEETPAPSQSGASEQLERAAEAEVLEPSEEKVLGAGPSDTEDGQQIAILRSDEQGVTLVQPAAPPPDRVVLDSIGYNEEGMVQLAGRASGAAAEIRVYLNNRSVARLAVDTLGGWRGVVPDVEPGIYRLRLDAMTSDGRVASRIETPFKREAPAALAAATSQSNGDATVRAVTVQAGDTLWAIARDRYGEGLFYVQVFEANREAILDPDLIYPGQVFDLPAD